MIQWALCYHPEYFKYDGGKSRLLLREVLRKFASSLIKLHDDLATNKPYHYPTTGANIQLKLRWLDADFRTLSRFAYPCAEISHCYFCQRKNRPSRFKSNFVRRVARYRNWFSRDFTPLLTADGCYWYYQMGGKLSSNSPNSRQQGRTSYSHSSPNHYGASSSDYGSASRSNDRERARTLNDLGADSRPLAVPHALFAARYASDIGLTTTSPHSSGRRRRRRDRANSNETNSLPSQLFSSILSGIVVKHSWSTCQLEFLWAVNAGKLILECFRLNRIKSSISQGFYFRSKYCCFPLYLWGKNEFFKTFF